MASTYFYYSPTTGTGNAQVTLSAASTNNTTTDKSASITITNGVSSATVNVIQYYKPYVVQGPTTIIPAAGGTITLTAQSHYDIVFRSVPLWLTIWSGNTQIQEGARVSLAPNRTNTCRYCRKALYRVSTSQNAGMNMSHYIGDTLYTLGAPIIECVQLANEGIRTDVSQVVFDWNQTTDKTFSVSANTNWTSTIVDD